jgi:predicted alpha-1,2-mannosidase
VIALWLWAACAPEPTTPEAPSEVPFDVPIVDRAAQVDPFLGTAGPGNVIPGALRPHGMVRASPDTRSGPGSIDAYDAGDALLEGFTHTHLEGPGGSDNGYSQVLLLPQRGDLITDRQARAVTLDHATEVASPGRYSVTVDGIEAALTATGHAAVHRYAFPAGPARILVDLGHSNGRSVGGAWRWTGAEILGYGAYNVHPTVNLITTRDETTAHTKVYTAIEASVPPTEFGTFAGDDTTRETPGADTVEGAWSGGWIGWTFDVPTTVEVRVGISYVSEDQARRNRDVELGTSSFDEVADAARRAWNTVLSRFDVQADPETEALFYSLLYHTAFQPSDHTEVGGVTAVGTSGVMNVREGDDFHYMTDDWCLWDTFRTLHPLGQWFEPERRDDIAESLLLQFREGGWLDKCPWSATGYSRVMIGNHGIPVLADAVMSGLADVDPDVLWEAVDKAGTQEIDALPQGLCGYVNLGTPPDYLRLGWVPHGCDPTQAASMTMETALNDAASSRLAEHLGRADDAARYAARQGNWRNHWDAEVGFMRGRNADGTWVSPFDPADMSGFASFVEASPWIFTFFVPHDVPGLAGMMGGDDVLRAKLDAFFDGGFHDPSNQPSFHIPWMYAHAGDPSATQARVRDVLTRNFRPSRDGLPGNDDAGAMSAWGVLAMLGLYPLDPGNGTWTLASPRVERATLYLHPGYYEGETLVIETVGDPATAPYVAGVTWNDVAHTEPTIDAATLARGGTLRFTLSETPTDWGAAATP